MDLDVNKPGTHGHRIKRLLLSPKEEWPIIDSEPMTTAEIFTKWVLPLAAIGPIAALIGSLLFGYGAFGITFRPSIGSAVSLAVTSYVMTLIGVYVMAHIYNALAPSFGGTKNFISALKLAAFASTAAWLAGVFQILPALSILAILGLYSLYLLYVGAPILMKLPAEKALGYVVAAIVAAVVVFLIVGAISSRLTGAFMPTYPMANSSSVAGSVKLPGGGEIDLGKMEQAARKMEAAAKRAEAGGPAVALEGEALQNMLPAALGSWQRTEVSSSSAAAGGFGGSRAEGSYRNGDRSFRLSVTDIAAAGGLAAMAGAFNVQSSRQTETGYEKTGTVDGRMTTEEWNNQRNDGKFGVLVASRFMVEAAGSADGIDTLKQAVASVDIGRLERLAR